MKTRFWCLIFPFLFIQITLFGQEYAITKYTKSEGLPSNYCYNTVQDDAGFLWICTEAGICTFDGNNFQTDLFPELFNKEIIRIKKDKKGRIWLLALSGEVYYIVKSKLHRLDFPNLGPKNKKIYMTLDGLGHLWLSEGNGFDATGFSIDDLQIKYKVHTFEEHVKVLKELGVLSSLESTRVENDRLSFSQQEKKISFSKFNIHKFFSDALRYDDQKTIFTYEQKMFYFDYSTSSFHRILEKYQSYLNPNIINFELDNHKNLWVATKNGFFRIKDPLSEDAHLDEYFTDARGASVTVDNQNNLWISTLSNGLIKLNETKITNYIDKKENNITSLLQHGKHIIYGTNKGEVVVLDSTKQEVYRQNTESKTSYIYNIQPKTKRHVLIVSESFVSVLNLESMTMSKLHNVQNLKSASLYVDRMWLNGGSDNYTTTRDSLKFRPVPPHIRSYCSFPISDSEAYIGTIAGLFKSNAMSNTFEHILPESISENIKVITQAPDSALWIGTSGNGIYILDKDTIRQHILSDLPSRFVTDIKSHDNTMWVATNNGLCKIYKLKDKYVFKTLNKSDGINSNEISGLCINNGKISVSSGSGISTMDLDIKFNNDIPIIKIDNIKINEKDTLIQSDYKLTKDQRNIKISFGGILFNKSGSIQYMYKLSGVDQEWVVTNQHVAQYPSLPPGDYKFLLRAKSTNSVWSSLEKINFTIPKHYTETQWFKAIILFSTCALMLVGFSFFTNSIKRKRQFKMSQMTALRAQMNPHFIFNSLNSVQDYILRDDKRAANKYISRFSKLMRYILNASDKEFTSLSEELEALELYLSIESMRFDNTLAYTIWVDPDLDPTKYKIPTMILQPYLENAIKHGLTHAKGDKKLIMSVKKQDHGLHIEITDNGIGRVNSKKIKLLNSTNYDSKGTAINQKRIELLNKNYQKENKVTFKDIYDINKNPTGTKVEILLQSIKFS